MTTETTFLRRRVYPSVNTLNFTILRFAPPKELSHVVDYLWILRWHEDAIRHPVEVLSDIGLAMILTSESAQLVSLADGKYQKLIQSEDYIGILFKPAGLSAFSPRRPDITNDIKGLSFLTAAEALLYDLFRQQDDAIIADMIWKLLLSKHPTTNQRAILFNYIIKTIQDDRSIQKVQHLSKLFSIPERTLQHMSKRYMGVGIKWLIRHYRLQDAATIITHQPVKWVELADDLGYSDQTHFIAEFKNAFSTTPEKYKNSITQDISCICALVNNDRISNTCKVTFTDSTEAL